MQAEAYAIKAKAAADAEQMAKKAEAWKEYGSAAMTDMMLDTLPKVRSGFRTLNMLFLRFNFSYTYTMSKYAYQFVVRKLKKKNALILVRSTQLNDRIKDFRLGKKISGFLYYLFLSQNRR